MTSFDEFKVGQYVSFEKSFSVKDQREFVAISGDTNELHVSTEYLKNDIRLPSGSIPLGNLTIKRHGMGLFSWSTQPICFP